MNEEKVGLQFGKLRTLGRERRVITLILPCSAVEIVGGSATNIFPFRDRYIIINYLDSESYDQ